MGKNKVDYYLAGSVTVLFLIGLIMVFSASSIMANSNFGSLTYFFRKQILWGFLALVVMIIFSKINYRKLKKNKFPLILIVVAILMLAGLPIFGTTVKGATRWYHLGFFNFQPSELAKLALIIYFAFFLSTRQDRIRDFKTGLAPLLAILLITLILILIQPDLSTTLMMVLITGAMLLLSRARLRHIMGMLLPVFPFIIYVMTTNNYQTKRISDWLAAWDNPLKAAYQIKQSLIGLGRGGWFGHGLGDSKQKFFFLPDSHTDFIFSIIGEEFGYIGTTIILFLFLVVFFRGLRLASKAPDLFGRYLAIGITLNIVLFAFINAAVVSMLLPATGLPMPFISYGGSNLLFLGMSVGILLNISRQPSVTGSNEHWMQFRDNPNPMLNRVLIND
ncbi:MAG TPA: putative lipid II flippase FtsW [Calditrichaeota bacterium]|nr:putative lipid II flippase FtsW [Calditrichota bacterium]